MRSCTTCKNRSLCGECPMTQTPRLAEPPRNNVYELPLLKGVLMRTLREGAEDSLAAPSAGLPT